MMGTIGTHSVGTPSRRLPAGSFSQGRANPYAMIMSGQMLLAWLGRKRNEPKAAQAAQHIQRAVSEVIADAKHLTRDLGGSAGTREMADAIAACVAQ